ncbi:PAS domain-containing protein [Pedobacter sp. HMF7647]|uniref:protein-glutamate O-methyltransferase n=1 Tax=Hufsiella arboris TaxID=2695275 RepID=A0A7K1YGB5_9SPHI|nr:CheR family methyltransferase [Hufsiella arboris]MXV53228.1 PAS domain-containing protein [Hufsiella arboris]
MKKQGAKSKGKLTPTEQLQKKPKDFLIVGIGASAGGIQALQQFFQQVPEDSYIAYVVILHLSPDHDSQLARVLQHETKIPVAQVTEKIVIEPDHIYVVPPDRHLVIEDGYIAVLPNLQIEERRAPVDIFFRTLADQHGPRAINVILSGTGANGSMGLKRTKERGGATFVQNPREAEFNEMPRNAIATDLVDEVLNVASIPARIIAYRDSMGTVEIIEEAQKRPETQQQALREIFTQLKARTGHDFSNYKRSTILRRIERRINVNNLPDLPSYAAFLHEHPGETHALLKDLLISVTNFFRDNKPFNGIEHDVMPAIFAGKTSAEQVRIWVAGCATGEEAYSMAMVCAEQAAGIIDAPKVQIFATDIDESVIATAREGFYTLNDAADVSPDRLRRFFNRDGDGYRVQREIREMILFAQHNFLKDPPFSKLDLVSCRNVFIYLNTTAQDRVIETFHFALRPKGFLFLGTSESVDGASDLYSVYSRDNHIFQSREVTRRSYPVPESVPQFHYPKADLLQRPEESEGRGQRISFGELHQKMLEQYAPPSVVVNEEYEIVHMTERAGKYFEFAGGEPTQNLLKLIRPQIRLELRSALYQAVQNNTAVEARNIKLLVNGEHQSLDIQVRPVLEDGKTPKGFILVIFKPAQEASQEGATIRLASDEPVARQLEEELIGLKTQLRNSTEQYEYQAEELKASNEELQAMNEELRSAAEELETSKEELQSINEELRTVNQELKVKIDETTIASNNLQNLVNSANVGTIFLDRGFAIRLFTPTVLDIFNLKASDYGRPVTDITNKLQYDGLLQDAEAVLEKLTIIEREVTTSDNRFFLMRLLPYRTSEDHINGVVITFFDITKRRESEEALRQSQEKYRIQLEQDVEIRTAELKESREQYSTLVENTPDMITRWDRELKLVFANTAFDPKTGLTNINLLGKTNIEMGQPDEIALPFMKSLRKVFETGETVEHFNFFQTQEGETWFYSRLTPEKNAEGEVETVLSVARDISEIKKAEQNIAQNNLRLKEAQSIGAIGSFEWNFDEEYVSWSDEMYRIVGLEPQSRLITIKFTDSLIPSEDLPAVLAIKEASFVTPGHYELQHRIRLNNGGEKWVAHRFESLGDDAGNVVRVHGTLQDITKQKKSEHELLSIKDELAQRATKKYLELFQSIDQGFCTITVKYDENDKPIDYQFIEVSPSFEYQTGIKDAAGKWIKDIDPEQDAFWFNAYGGVAKNRKADRFEYLSNSRSRWWSVYAFPIDEPKQRRIGVLFNDITERKRREANLAFLAEVSQDLVRLTDIDETMDTLGVKIGYYFNLSRCVFAEIVEAEDKVIIVRDWCRSQFSNLVGEMPISQFINEEYRQKSRAGETIVVSNVHHSSLVHGRQVEDIFKVVSFVNVPIIKDGQWRFTLGIYDAVARDWAGDEIELLRELTSRIWTRIERAWAEEALRKSEEKYRNQLTREVAERTNELKENYSLLQTIYDTTLIGISVFVPVRDKKGTITDFRIVMVNKKIERSSTHSDLVGKLYSQLYPGIRQIGLFDLMVKTIETGEPGKTEYHYNFEGIDRWYSTMFVKGEDILVSTNLDITEQKRSEEERFRNYVLLQQSEELAATGSWDYDLLTDNFIWSDGMYRLFNVPKGIEVSPDIYIQYATPDCYDTAARIISHIKHGDAEFDETLKIEVEGTVKVVKIKAAVLKNEEGHPVRVLGVDMDVTATRAAEEKLRKMESELQLEIFRETLNVQEEERRRISESLHNGIGQILYGVKISLSGLSQDMSWQEFGKAKTYTNKLLTDSIAETRRVSHELMPTTLEEFGLQSAIDDICHQLSGSLHLTCTIRGLKGRLEKYLELAVYRTVQELITNMVKHAHATEAAVEIVIEQEKVFIQVSDNGQGMENSRNHKPGIGLSSIRSKIKLLNGEVTISSATGKGTDIRVFIPMPKRE